jgi:hypothetical protein
MLRLVTFDRERVPITELLEAGERVARQEVGV